MIYRRAKGTSSWHFRSDCTHWPTDDYIRSTGPVGSDLCDECIRKTDDHAQLQALSDLLHGEHEPPPPTKS